MADNPPTSRAEPSAGSGSASAPHPSDGIPLPAHGFETLDDMPLRELVTVPAREVITRAAVLLMSSAADKLGLRPDGEPNLDLPDARRLIAALAALLAAARDEVDDFGADAPLWDGLRSLQQAYHESARYPDEPGAGPGEKYLS